MNVSLDAIHLATALLIRPQVEDLRFATHDLDLGIAARAMGLTVLGLPARPVRTPRRTR